MSVEQNRRTTNMQLAYLAWALWIVCWFFSDRGIGSSTLVPVQHWTALHCQVFLLVIHHNKLHYCLESCTQSVQGRKHHIVAVFSKWTLQLLKSCYQVEYLCHCTDNTKLSPVLSFWVSRVCKALLNVVIRVWIHHLQVQTCGCRPEKDVACFIWIRERLLPQVKVFQYFRIFGASVM